MENKATINFPFPLMEEFCRKNFISKLSLFGSQLHQNSSPGSDVDILVEFEEGHTPGFAFARMQRELSEILGHNVDLHTPFCLSPYFRADVVKEALPFYVTAKS